MLRPQIKKFLGPWLWLRLKDLLYYPSGVSMGTHSYTFRSFKINQPHTLCLGSQYETFANSCIGTRGSGIPIVRIGNSIYIGRQLYLTAIDRITVGAPCMLSNHIYITDCAHGMDPHGDSILHQPLESKRPITIGDGCFLGYRTVILPGVTLGAHCVVGANAVVTRSFRDYSMLAGAPALVIKHYSQPARQWLATDDQNV